MKLGWLQDLSWRYMKKLYQLSEGGLHPEVNVSRLLSEIGCSREEARSVHEYLESKGLISWKCRVMHVRITPAGIDEVERIMQNQKGQALEKLYELAGGRIQFVAMSDLAQSLGRSFDETYDDLGYWADRGFVEMSNNVDKEYEEVKLTRAGLNAIEQPNNPGTPNGRQQNITYNLSLHDNRGNISMGGHGNTQTNVVVGSDFENAIRQLVAGIEQSQVLSPLQKIRVKSDVQAVNDLARVKKTPEIVTEARSRIDGIQTVLSTTADLVSLGMVVIPILQAVFGG
jgi:predicted transcriptional regulator